MATLLSDIPLALRERDQWVLWKMDDGVKKPYEARSGQLASSSDKSSWTSFEEASARLDASYEGLGYVFAEDDPFTGVDLDACLEGDEIAGWAADWIQQFDSYTEVSPSGSGVKIWIIGDNPRATGKNIKLKDVPGVSGKSAGVEWYDRGRFFCVTGRSLNGDEIQPRQEVLQRFADHFDKPPAKTKPRIPSSAEIQDGVLRRARRYLQLVDPAISGQGGHNTTFRAACALVMGFELTCRQAVDLLMEEYNDRCEPPWSRKEIEHKVNDADKQSGQRGWLKQRAPEEAAKQDLSRYDREPPKQLTTLKESTARYLEHLKEGKDLMQLGVANLDDALGGGVAPGELVLVAARPSHGKSAIALQCLDKATQSGMNALMVSEEMSALTLGKRAIQFASEVPTENWRDQDENVRRDLETHFSRRADCFIVESCRTPDRVEEVVEKAVEEHDVKIVAVDYGQLLTGKGNGRREQQDNVSVRLRQMTSRLNIVTIVLVQLNRDCEKRETSFKPRISDIRDSGQFEQDADVIVMLAWPHRFNQQNDPHEFHIYIGKNRNRAITDYAVQCKFYPMRQMFLHQNPRNYQTAFDEWNNQ